MSKFKLLFKGLLCYFFLAPFILPIFITDSVHRSNIYASAHSRLKEKLELKRFKNISLKLVCQCGCKLLLDNCNHFSCMAWSMRSIIDSLIINGYSNAFILNGFQNGFHKLINNKKIMTVLQNDKYEKYKADYKNGFGLAVYSVPQNNTLTIWIIVLSVLFTCSYVILFIHRKKKKIIVSKETKKTSEEEEGLWKSLYRG